MASTQGNSAISAIRKWKPLTISLRHAHSPGKSGSSFSKSWAFSYRRLRRAADDVELVAATAFLGKQRATARS